MGLAKGKIALQYRVRCGSKKCNNYDDFWSIGIEELESRVLREGWSKHWEEGWVCPSCTNKRRYGENR